MEASGAQETAREAVDHGPIRVKFGPGQTQDMPREWAVIMLTGLHQRHAAVFGKLLAEAASEAK